MRIYCVANETLDTYHSSSVVSADYVTQRTTQLHRLFFALCAAVITIAFAAESQTRFEESPFLWAGKSYADSNWKYMNNIHEKYADIPFAYPSAQSCVSGSAKTDIDLATADLKWTELQTNETVEICLFRVLSRLKTTDKITKWMIKQGWVDNEVYDSSSTAHLLGSPGPTTRLGFFWDSEKLGKPFGSRYREPISEDWFFRRIRSAQVSVTLDNQRGVLGLTIGTRGWWHE